MIIGENIRREQFTKNFRQTSDDDNDDEERIRINRDDLLSKFFQNWPKKHSDRFIRIRLDDDDATIL